MEVCPRFPYNGDIMDELLPIIPRFTGPATLATNALQSGNEAADVFQQMLDLILKEVQGSFSSALIAGESDVSGLAGMTGSDTLAPTLLQMLAPYLQDSMGVEGLGSSTIMQQAFAIQINQFDAERQVGGDGANANCGPASLAMALQSLGLSLDGCSWSSSEGELVDRARQCMTAAWQDGVDANGQRVEAEHSTFTTLTDIERGARAAGATTRRIEPDPAAIRLALLSGEEVIVSGTFAGKSPLPWTGDREHDWNSAPGGATGHFVLVSGYDPSLDLFVVNDPARNSPLMTDAQSLSHFMDGNAGALALRN